MSKRVILVHGAWHGSWVWGPVLPLLRARGIEPITVDLPSSHHGGDLLADAAAVREVVHMAEEPTVLVGHSYGGMVITEASVDLAPVTDLVYVCAYMLDTGRSVFDTVDGPVDWLDVDIDAGIATVSDPRRAFYADLPAELGQEYASRLTAQSLGSLGQPLTGAGWHAIESSYLICTQDQAIPLEQQRVMAAQATRREEVESSHTPMASSPETVTEVIAAAAGA